MVHVKADGKTDGGSYRDAENDDAEHHTKQKAEGGAESQAPGGVFANV